MHHMKAHQMTFTMMQTDWKSDNKKLRNSKIGREITNMLEKHRRASHAILMHRREFSTSRRRCVASQRVAGPLGDDDNVVAVVRSCEPSLMRASTLKLDIAWLKQFNYHT